MANSALFNGNAWVRLTPGSPPAQVYVGLQVYITSTQYANFDFGNVGEFIRVTSTFLNELAYSFASSKSVVATNDLSLPSNILTADSWHQIEMMLNTNSGSQTFVVNGTEYGIDHTGPSAGVCHTIDVGQGLNNQNVLGGARIGTVWLGSSWGTSDIKLEDWSSGNTSGWSSEQTLNGGSVVVGNAPVTPPTFSPSSQTPVLGPLEGFCVAFDAAPLDSNPDWSRLDDKVSDGLSVQRITINRGRPTERDKTSIGTMQVSIVDTAGVLDPTNPTSVYVNKLNPIKQTGYALLNPVTLEYGILYRGFVDNWNHDLTGLDKSGLFDQVGIDCSDALAIISDAEIIPDTAGNTVPAESTGDVYYDPVTITKDRILAAIADTATTFNPYGEDWPADQLEIFTGNVKLKGVVYSPRTSLIQVIDDAADAEFPGIANRFVSKDGKITFHGRLARFNPTDPQYHISFWNAGDAAAFDNDDTVAVLSELQFSRGKDNLINAALATPSGINDADISGQFVSDPTSVAAYGARSISFENLLTDGHSDGSTTDLQETLEYAQYFVDNYKDPRTRISQIVFRPQPPGSDYGPSTWALMCGVDISDVVHVTTTHPGGGGFNEDYYVEGITYEIVPMNDTNPEVTLTLDLSPTAYYDTSSFAGPLAIVTKLLTAAGTTVNSVTKPTTRTARRVLPRGTRKP